MERGQDECPGPRALGFLPGVLDLLHLSSRVLTNEWPKGRCQGREFFFLFYFIICLCVARPPFWSIEKSFFFSLGASGVRNKKVMQKDKQVAANGQKEDP